MANQFVSVQEPSSPTKKMQTFENTIASNVVEAEAITLVDSTGIERATATNPARVDPTGTTTQPVSGTVAVSNFPGTQPVSFTTPYDVKIQNPSGTEVDPTTPADVTATGTLTDTVGTVVLNVAGRVGIGFTLTGTWSGNVVCQGSVDGTNWTTMYVHQVAGGWVSIITGNGTFQCGVVGGLKQVRVKFLTFSSGSLTVSMLEDMSPGFILDFASSSGGVPPPEFAAIAGVDGGSTITRRIEALIANPVGTEPGLVVRPIPSGTQNVAEQDPTLVTYSANYRLVDSTAGQLSLTFTFAANTDKQLATIYHAATSTKTVRIRKITIIVSTGALGVFGFEVRRLSATTAPATGNPAITPLAHDPGDAVAEATTLALPTTAGSQFSADSTVKHVEWNSAAAAATANPSGLTGEEIVLFEADLAKNIKPLVMRSSNAEGYAVVGRSTTAVALRFVVYTEFTEQ